VNRARVAELCGFTSVIENSFDAIGDVDYNIDTAQAVIRIAVDLSRVGVGSVAVGH
jgi:argininosuccinate lyase